MQQTLILEKTTRRKSNSNLNFRLCRVIITRLLAIGVYRCDSRITYSVLHFAMHGGSQEKG